MEVPNFDLSLGFRAVGMELMEVRENAPRVMLTLEEVSDTRCITLVLLALQDLVSWVSSSGKACSLWTSVWVLLPYTPKVRVLGWHGLGFTLWGLVWWVSQFLPYTVGHGLVGVSVFALHCRAWSRGCHSLRCTL